MHAVLKKWDETRYRILLKAKQRAEERVLMLQLANSPNRLGNKTVQ